MSIGHVKPSHFGAGVSIAPPGEQRFHRAASFASLPFSTIGTIGRDRPGQGHSHFPQELGDPTLFEWDRNNCLRCCPRRVLPLAAHPEHTDQPASLHWLTPSAHANAAAATYTTCSLSRSGASQGNVICPLGCLP
jgi:hypothetical protein